MFIDSHLMFGGNATSKRCNGWGSRRLGRLGVIFGFIRLSLDMFRPCFYMASEPCEAALALAALQNAFEKERFILRECSGWRHAHEGLKDSRRVLEALSAAWKMAAGWEAVKEPKRSGNTCPAHWMGLKKVVKVIEIR